MTIFKEFNDYDAVGLAALVREQSISSKELVATAIDNIERLNPRLNAVVEKLYDQALEAAGCITGQEVLAGVPFLVKDLLSPVKGTRHTSGSRFCADVVADHDAELIRRYRAAGLVIVGKTSTPEFGIMPVTEPILFGPCRNPWDTNRTPGGSSGGSAAAVASGMVPVAHGGDGGGSLRIPGSCCGVFALKPTRGRNPTGPHASERWLGFATEHVLTRSVRDSAALLDASAGPEPTSPYWAPPPERPFLDEVGAPTGRLRIAFSDRPQLPSTVHRDCASAVRDAALLCAELGHDVCEAAPPIDPEGFAHAFFVVICGSVAAGLELAAHELGRRPARHELEIATWLAELLGREFSAGNLIAAIERLQGYARTMHRFFEQYDVLLTPTLGSPPLPIGALAPHGAEALAHRTIANLRLGSVLRLPRVIDATIRRIFAFVPFTPLANATGQPSMSVPLWWNSDGLPIGTSFTARLGAEGTLFRLARALEVARPWWHRIPPVHAARELTRERRAS
jgi:amidase